MNNEEMIQKAAVAMVPILEQESNMLWGERSCANILRWTLAKAGFRLTPLQADAATARMTASRLQTPRRLSLTVRQNQWRAL